jgi:hypothetical protein
MTCLASDIHFTPTEIFAHPPFLNAFPIGDNVGDHSRRPSNSSQDSDQRFERKDKRAAARKRMLGTHHGQPAQAPNSHAR